MAGLSPSDCERIIIVGAGGFGREVLQWARHAWPEHVSKIAGFLSADPDKLDGHAPTLPILGSPADFQPQPTDGLVLAIGIPRVRRQVAEQLEANGARFLTLIHATAIVADSAQIGTGTVICPFVLVSDGVQIGRHCLLNYHSSVAHDGIVGDGSVLSPHSAVAGDVQMGQNVFLGIHASVGPRVQIDDDTVVSANSACLRSTGHAAFVYGVPGRVRPHVRSG